MLSLKINVEILSKKGGEIIDGMESNNAFEQSG
jgi:hypothetical protein